MPVEPLPLVQFDKLSVFWKPCIVTALVMPLGIMSSSFSQHNARLDSQPSRLTYLPLSDASFSQFYDTERLTHSTLTPCDPSAICPLQLPPGSVKLSPSPSQPHTPLT